MNDKRQQIIEAEHPINALSEIISPQRLGTYMQSAGHDPDRALSMYLWNAKMGEAFHLPIQSVEVGLRNRVCDGIVSVFGPDWWKDEKFIKEAGNKRKQDIDLVLRRLNSKKIPHEVGQIVAGLSFGFWIAMLHGRHNRTIWSAQLKTAFPNLPNQVDRKKLHQKATEIADFRNRISHHEPIFKRDLSGDFSTCMLVLSWLCPTKKNWIKPHCRVSAMLREKP